MTFIFLAKFDLTEQQRYHLTSHLALHSVSMHECTQDTIPTSFRILLMSTETRISGPSVRTGGPLKRTGRQRSFYFFEAGEFVGEQGYWAVDEEDENAKKFLSTRRIILDPE